MKKVSSKILAILLSFAVIFSMMPGMAMADDATITVKMTVSNQGVLATANDGSLMANRDVTVTDINGDGHFSYDEALVAAHKAYNSESGYEGGSEGWVTKLWGEAGSFSFFANDVAIAETVDSTEISEDDNLVTIIMEDGVAYSDYYTYFDKKNVEITAGSHISLKLKGKSAAYLSTSTDLGNFEVKTYQQESGIVVGTTSTNESGTVELTFDTPGTYVITTSGNVKNTIDLAEMWILMEIGKDTSGRTVYGKSDWRTYDIYKAYTETEYEVDNYPLAEIKYELLDSDEEDTSELEYDEGKYPLYSSKVVATSAITAPACIVTVKPVTVGGGGTVAPETQEPTVNVTEGGITSYDATTGTLTITPAEGYKVADVIVNGVSKGAVTSLTGLTKNDVVEIKFEAASATDPVVDNSKTIKGVKATTVTASTKKTSKGIKVTWKKSAGYKVDKYQVYRSTSGKKGTFKKVYTTKSAKTTSYTNKGLKKGKTYYYKVRGVRKVDGKNYYTKWSKVSKRTFK